MTLAINFCKKLLVFVPISCKQAKKHDALLLNKWKSGKKSEMHEI